MNKVVSILGALIPPVIFLYPQGILGGTYVNYFSTIFVAYVVWFGSGRKPACKSLKFFTAWFWLQMFGNIVSLAMGKIDTELLVKSTGSMICIFCLSIIVTRLSQKGLKLFFTSLAITSVLAIALILIDGAQHPLWLYLLYGVEEFDENGAINIYYRAVGSLLSPVMAGFYCATVITYCLTMMMYGRHLLTHSLVGVAALAALMFTVSRTAMLAIAFMFIFFAVFYKPKRKGSILLIAVLALIVVYFVDLSFLDKFIENLTQRNEQFQNGYFRGTGREATIEDAFKHKFDWRCLLWGIGPAQYSIHEEFTSLAHNGLLSIFFPMGLIGVGMYYVNIKRYIVVKYKKWLHKPFILFTSLWLIMYLGTFFSADVTSSFFSMALMAMIWGLCDRIKLLN